MDGNVAKDCD